MGKYEKQNAVVNTKNEFGEMRDLDYLSTVVGFLNPTAQDKTLGRDAILYAVRQQRGLEMKLLRGGWGCKLGVNKGLLAA